MAKNEQQRQKKLAKKRSKEIKSSRALAQRRQAMSSLSGQMQWASSYPVHRCFISDSIFNDTGMGVIFFTRRLGDGRVAMMFLLIDSHCLGVKDAGGRICTVNEFEQAFEKSQHNSTFQAAEPARARKLTEDAIAYAQSLGFSPHADYRKVAPLWGDVDATQCSETFEFGLNGKPSYFAGPHDDPARQNTIFRRLCESVGEGNFHFTLGGPGMSLGETTFAEIDAGELQHLDFVDDEQEDDQNDLRLDGPEPLRIDPPR